MNVARFMRTDPITVLPSASLADAKRLMDEHGFGLLLVADEAGVLDGFLTRGALKSVADLSLPVSRIRTPVRFAVSPTDTVERAALVLLAHQLVVLPVVDEGHLVGVITQTEVLRAIATGLGIGVEGTRLTIQVRPGSDDVYRALRILGAHEAKLLSVVSGRSSGERHLMILRVQGVADRERLCRELEAALTVDEDA